MLTRSGTLSRITDEQSLLRCVNQLLERCAYDRVPIAEVIDAQNKYGIAPMQRCLLDGIGAHGAQEAHGAGSNRALMSKMAFMSLYMLGSRMSAIERDICYPLLVQHFDSVVEDYLATHVSAALKRVRDEGVLCEFRRRWVDHRHMTSWLVRLYKYLDTSPAELLRPPDKIPAESPDASPDESPEKTPAFPAVPAAPAVPAVKRWLTSRSHMFFKNIVFDAESHRIFDRVHTMLCADRQGEIVDRSLVRDVIQMVLIMGVIDETHNIRDDRHMQLLARSSSASSSEVYLFQLENAFLKHAEQHYTTKSHSWAGMSTTAYLQKTEAALQRESAICDACLPTSTKTKLMTITRKCLIAGAMDDLLRAPHSGMSAMLSNIVACGTESAAADELLSAGTFACGGGGGAGGGFTGAGAGASVARENVSRMYRMIGPVAGGVNAMATFLREHVVAFGEEILRKRASRCSEAVARAGQKKSKPLGPYDPDHIDALISMQTMYRRIIAREFEGDATMAEALRFGMERVLNQPAGSHGHPELLAAYIDSLLRGKKGTVKISEEEADGLVTDALGLFVHFIDKDVFREFYRAHLSRRVLGNKSISDHIERATVTRLKTICAPMFTFRLEGMLNDFALSKEMNADYRGYSAAHGLHAGVKMSAHVLKAAHWPSFLRIPGLKPPSEMVACTHAFTAYYASKPESCTRKLVWLWTQGTATVRVTLNRGWKDFVVTTLQAVAILLFNKHNRLTVQEIAEETGIDKSNVRRIMASMCSVRTLQLFKKIGSEGMSLRDTDVLELDSNYQNSRRTVTLPSPSLVEKTTSAVPDNDRRNTVDAALVRVMKARKTLPHQQLVSEVMAQIRFFRPEVKFIKTRIANLIERNYIRRDDPTRHDSPYVYVRLPRSRETRRGFRSLPHGPRCVWMHARDDDTHNPMSPCVSWLQVRRGRGLSRVHSPCAGFPSRSRALDRLHAAASARVLFVCVCAHTSTNIYCIALSAQHLMNK